MTRAEEILEKMGKWGKRGVKAGGALGAAGLTAHGLGRAAQAYVKRADAGKDKYELARDEIKRKARKLYKKYTTDVSDDD